MKNIILCGIIFLLSACSYRVEYPKMAIYGTSPTLHSAVVKNVAKYDLVILDFENWTNNPGSIRMLRKANKNIKILAYGNPIEVYSRKIKKRPLNLQLSEMMKRDEYQSWWLWTDKKKHAVFYTRLPYLMMNISSLCPKINGEKWNGFIADFYIQHALTVFPKPDGFFGDNAADNWYWTNESILAKRKLGWIDSNMDGLPDEKARLDPAWKKGMEEFYTHIRQEMGPDFLIYGNKGNMELVNVLDGKMFEEFPFSYGGPDKRAGGWYQCMESYLKMGENAIIQIKWPSSKKHLMFTLSSALLGDGYFALGHNFSGWLPEFKSVGIPLGPYQVDNDRNIWYREFSGATVKVYPEARKGEIIYK